MKLGIFNAAFVVAPLVALTGVFFGVLATAEEDSLESLLENEGKPKLAAPDNKSPLRQLVGKPTPEQNIFFSLIENQETEKALFQWTPAFSKTELGKSANGKALHGVLSFQAGLPLTGLEEILSIPDPENVHPSLIKILKESVPADHAVWNQYWSANWNTRWSSIFGTKQEIRVVSKNLNGFQDGAKINSLLARAEPGSFESNLLKWQIVLGLSTQDTAKAGKALAALMKLPNPATGMDLMNITAARMLYQNGYLDGAIKYYEKVPDSSDYWFEAQEEKGWAYLRKGQTQDTIAITQSLNHSSVVWLSGPEASFLRSLAQLKVCDYKGVVKTLENFKLNFKERTASLVKISKDANTPEVLELISQRGQGPIEFPKMGSNIKKLPRWSIRDIYFGNLARFYQGINAEAKRAGELYMKSLSQGSDRVGFQAGSERIKQAIEQRAAGVKSAMITRVQALAQQEVEETQNILSKLQIVEAEMIQQSTVLDKIAGRATTSKPTVMNGKNKANNKYQIQFPGDEEIWFDEIASYDVDVKGGCEGVKR